MALASDGSDVFFCLSSSSQWTCKCHVTVLDHAGLLAVTQHIAGCLQQQQHCQTPNNIQKKGWEKEWVLILSCRPIPKDSKLEVFDELLCVFVCMCSNFFVTILNIICCMLNVVACVGNVGNTKCMPRVHGDWSDNGIEQG